MSGSGSEQGSPVLRVQGSSRLAFGATTAALITLASGGTAALVAHGTASVSSPTRLPGALLTEAPGAAGPVVVARAPGTEPPPAVPEDRTVEALRGALAASPGTGRRTLVAQLVALTDSAQGLTPALPALAQPALPVVAQPALALPTRLPVPVPTPTPVPATVVVAQPAAAGPAVTTRAGKGHHRSSGAHAAGRSSKGKGKHAR